jgi:hypothetical protein
MDHRHMLWLRSLVQLLWRLPWNVSRMAKIKEAPQKGGMTAHNNVLFGSRFESLERTTSAFDYDVQFGFFPMIGVRLMTTQLLFIGLPEIVMIIRYV